MSKVKFSIKADERLFLSDTWVCNGHWMVKRDHAKRSKAFAPVLNLQNGSYQDGYKHPKNSDDLPDMERVIPGKDGYQKAEITREAIFSPDRMEVTAVKIQSGSYEAFVQSRYVELLTLGEVFIKDKTAPIRIEDQGEVIAVVMPWRA